jgi:predicted neutral ceramidase superfamily lipid hydrolase
MSEPVLVLSVIAVLFVGMLVLKSITKWKFCVICASVSTMWMALLVLYWLGRFDQPVIIAVLMGQSVVGLYYFLEKNTAEALHIFRLPLLLTLTLVAFVALGATIDLQEGVGLLAAIWGVLSLLYLYRQNPKTKIVVDRIIACCKDW